MNRGLLAVFAFVLLAGPVFAQTANKVVLRDFRISGDVAPGGEFRVYFKLRDLYNWELKDVNVQLEGGYPFLKASPVSVGYASIIRTYRDSNEFFYDLKVDDSANTGDYSFNILVHFSAFAYQSEYQTFTNTIPVKLRVSAAPQVGAGIVGSDPAEISEGQSTVLSVKVWNQGLDRAKNVWLDASDTKELDVAFAYGRSYVGDLESKGTKTVEISVRAEDGIAPATYRLPIRIEYESNNGSRYAYSSELPVEVQKAADFEISGVKQDELSANQKDGLVEINLKNTGTKTAKDIRLTLLAKYPFTPTGKTYYVSEIAPGGQQQASFHVDVDEQASVQKYPADLQVEWREDETEKSSTERFSLSTSPRKEASEDFWEKLWVRKDAKLLVGLAGLFLFFALLSSFKKTR